MIISHLHLDHCYDLLPLGKSLIHAAAQIHGAGQGGSPRQVLPVEVDLEPVPLLVPPGAAAVLRELAALFPVTTAPVLDRAFDLAFAVREYAPGLRTRLGGSIEVELIGLQHSAANCGVRVTGDGVTLAYTGDTGTTPAFLDLARGADVLLAECTLAETDTSGHGHLSAADAGRVAAAAGVGELVLTHFTSTDPHWLRTCVERAAAEFDGPVHVARPLSTITVGDPARVSS